MPRCSTVLLIRPANEGIEVWLCVEPVDFRKQIATLVQDTLAMDPFSTQLFVFAGAPSAGSCTGKGAGRAVAKAPSRFAWPRRTDAVVNLSGAQLNSLLDGYDLGACARMQLHYASMY